MTDEAPQGGPFVQGLRLALTTFTVLPLRPARVSASTASVAMTVAPVVGLLLGAGVAAAAYGAEHLWSSPAVAGVLVVVLLAAVTGGLHLDGLADTADGVGMTADRDRRLAVMREGSVGAFGAAAVAAAVVIDTAAIALAVSHGEGTTVLLTAVAAGRLGVTWACTSGVPAARPDGLGAAVAGTVDRAWAISLTIAVTVTVVVTARIADGDWHAGGHVCAGVAAAVVAALLLRWAAYRRLGGVTGDILGAVVEIGTVASLLASTARM